MYFTEKLPPDVAAAQALLNELKQEKVDLPAKLRSFSNAGDGDGIVALTNRRNTIDAYIYAAQIKLSQAKIAALEAEKAEARLKNNDAAREMGAQIEQIQKRIEDAEQLARDLHMEKDLLILGERASYNTVYELNIQIEREQGMLKKLMNDHIDDLPKVDENYERSDIAMYERSGYGHAPANHAAPATIPATGHREVSIPGSLRVEYTD